MMARCRLLLLGSPSWVSGCSKDAPLDPHDDIVREIENRLTFRTGVYGQTTSYDDVGNNSVEYNPMTLEVFVKRVAGKKDLVGVRSDEVGFFEMELGPGADYEICTAFGRCAEFKLDSRTCVRLDYEFSVGPGWSAATTIPCPSR